MPLATRETQVWQRAIVPLELAAVIAVLTADQYGLVPWSNTPFVLALAWLSLRLRGARWRDVGLVWPARPGRALALGVAAGLAMELIAIYVSEPTFARWLGHLPDRSDFRPLIGNVALLALALALNWTLAAVGEEMVYRGFLLDRVATLFGRSRLGWGLALCVVSALFGWAHREGQGAAGMVQEGFAGLLLGLLYLASKRNLTIPIVAHGVSNTLAFALIYFGRYPGL